MSEVSDKTNADAAGAATRSYYHLRRLHSLLGLVPVGVFLCFHLTLNATVLAGPDKYQAAVLQLHSLSRIGLLIPLETLFIFLPLLFHAWLGVLIVFGGSVNVHAYRFGGNIRYLLQRFTGLMALGFLAFHLWQMHWLGKPFGGGVFVPDDPMLPLSATLTAAAAIQSSGTSILIYALGVAASCFHLANGIWTALITWGITLGPRSQRVSGIICAVFGVALAALGLAALAAFVGFDFQAQLQH